MLILQRKEGQSLTIGDRIVVTVQEIGQGRVRLSVDAPRDIAVLRTELVEAQQENRSAAQEKESPMQLLQMLRKEKEK
ncbi:carbon storage regulator [Agathobaculum sp. Marseille-P7918]|uniref:carbon storage regulator n=1 Tax=Agathobaculum sp. Marseille-P7918 TaxID=2479843 RepID=UPI0035674015